MKYSTTYSSPLGLITMESDGENLIGLWLEGQEYFANNIEESMVENNDLNIFIATKQWLNRYFLGEKPEISELPLAPIGGEFRKIVWEILCQIPYGETITYGEVAKK